MAILANEQIMGTHRSGSIGATLGLPSPSSQPLDFEATLALFLPTSKSLEFIALGAVVPPWGYIANERGMAIHCSGASSGYICQPATQRNPLLYGYWGYLRATHANQQIIGTHCSGATLARLGIHLPKEQVIGIQSGLRGLP